MSLSDQGKKLFSKIAIILGSILIVAVSYWGVSSLFNEYKLGKNNEKKRLIEMYESRIDSIRIVNNMLTYQVDSLDKQIAITKEKKILVYIDKTKTDKVIQDASADTHAKAIDSLTKQLPTWAIVKDSIVNDTLIHYKFTKPGVTNLRLYINDLKQYKGLYAADESIIKLQDSKINLQATIISNDKIALKDGESALAVSKTENSKLEKQLNKAQKRVGRWPYWLGAGFIGGVTVCLLAQ